MTDEQIIFAGRLMKILTLARSPGMDIIAIKLNSGLTYDEEKITKRWANAFKLAQTDDNLFEAAAKLAKMNP